MSDFKREPRYLVLKQSDLDAAGLTNRQQKYLYDICTKVIQARNDAGKPKLECVVIESDWPEYEPTWTAIEARMKCTT